MSCLVGLIPAAGRGVRAYPYTVAVPKSMLAVDGVPLIERSVELMRDQLGIRDIRVVVGYQGHVIRAHLGDGSRLGVEIQYLVNDRLELDLPYSVFLAAREIDAPCLMILGDELYVGSNHGDLLRQRDPQSRAVCGLVEVDNQKAWRKNYAVDLVDGVVVGLTEKPRTVPGRRMGTGTYLLDPDVLRRLVAEFTPDVTAGPRDWTGWLDRQCRAGVRMTAFLLSGDYVNVNSRDDLNHANLLVRSRDFARRTTSLVYYVDHAGEAGPEPILRFAARPEIDEVVVVAQHRYVELDACVQEPKVRLAVPDQACTPAELIRLGFDCAQGDILLLTAGDGTFMPSDVCKLLVYLRDADVVLGTRTTRQMIEQGANMRGVIRLAHIALAKAAELLWWKFEARFTDLCCLYRGFWRSSYRMIRDQLDATGVEIFPELVLEALRARQRIIEVPVNYYNRAPGTPYVRSPYQTFGTFWAILRLIVRKRWEDLWLRRG